MVAVGAIHQTQLDLFSGQQPMLQMSKQAARDQRVFLGIEGKGVICEWATLGAWA